MQSDQTQDGAAGQRYTLRMQTRPDVEGGTLFLYYGDGRQYVADADDKPGGDMLEEIARRWNEVHEMRAELAEVREVLGDLIDCVTRAEVRRDHPTVKDALTLWDQAWTDIIDAADRAFDLLPETKEANPCQS